MTLKRGPVLLLALLGLLVAAPGVRGQPETQPSEGACRVLGGSREARERARWVLAPVLRRFALHFGNEPAITVRLVSSVRRARAEEPDVLRWFDREAFLRDPERHVAAIPLMGVLVTSVEDPGTVKVVACMPAVAGAPTSPLQRGDLVLGVDGEPMHAARALADRIRAASPGEELVLELDRDGRVLEAPYERGADVASQIDMGIDVPAMREWVRATTPSLEHAAAHGLFQDWARAEMGSDVRPPPWLSEAVALLVGGLGERQELWRDLLEAANLSVPVEEVLARTEPAHDPEATEQLEGFQATTMAVLRSLMLAEGATRAGPVVGRLLAGEDAPPVGEEASEDVARLLAFLGTWEGEGASDPVRLQVLPDRVLVSHVSHEQLLAVTGLGANGLRVGHSVLSLANGGSTLAVDLPVLGARVLQPSGRDLDLGLAPLDISEREAPTSEEREALQSRLARLVEQDQAARHDLTRERSAGQDEGMLAAIGPLRTTDRACSRELREFLTSGGWPSGEAFGPATVNDVWLLAHHSGDLALQLTVLPHLRREHRAGRLDTGALELFTDRLRKRLGGALLATDHLPAQDPRSR